MRPKGATYMALLTLKSVSGLTSTKYGVIEFHGELDKSSVDTAESQITEALSQFNRKYLLFDFSSLSYINSEGIGFLVSVHMKLVKKNAELLLVNPKPNVADIFELVGLKKIIPVFKSMSEALVYVQKGA